MPKISEDHVPLAAEDRFLIISIQEAASLCPGANDAAALGEAIQVAKPFLGDLTPLFDLRGLPHIYNDVDAFIHEVASPGSHILVNSRTAQQIDLKYLATRRGLNVLSVKGHSYKARHFDMSDLRCNSFKSDDPFFRLSQTIEDQLTYGMTSGRDLELDDELEFEAPSLEQMRRVLTPKKLAALIKRDFPRRLWKRIKASEFAHSIRIFFPKMEESLAHFDSHTTSPVPETTEFYTANGQE